MTVPPFVLSEQDLGPEGSKQLRQLLWAQAAAAAAAELPPPPVTQQLLHPEDASAEWVVLQELSSANNRRSFGSGKACAVMLTQMQFCSCISVGDQADAVNVLREK
jgi:hypothetical protein